MRDPADTSPQVVARLGAVELRVSGALGARGYRHDARSAAGVPGHAYTTLMTTADRLFRKRLLTRQKMGRAFGYAARWSRADTEARLASSALATLFPGDAVSMSSADSLFVDEVSRRDASMLDELESLIRLKKDEER